MYLYDIYALCRFLPTDEADAQNKSWRWQIKAVPRACTAGTYLALNCGGTGRDRITRAACIHEIATTGYTRDWYLAGFQMRSHYSPPWVKVPMGARPVPP